MGFHSDQDTGQIHQIHNGEVSDYASMIAATYQTADIGKVYRLGEGHGGYYILRSTTPSFFRMGNEEVAQVSTTDATETELFAFTTASDYIYHIEARVIASVNGGGNGASYLRIASFKNDSGTLSIIGTTSATHTGENDANWDCQIEASGTDINVDVTGVAATDIDWTGYIRIYAQPNGA